MEKILRLKIIKGMVLSFAAMLSVGVQAVPVTSTKLTGITGGAPAGTAVYRADLDSVGISDLLSISIADVSGGFGGAPGQFSGFDLDAIILSNTLCLSATCAAGLTGLSLFDYTAAGTIFNEGTQRVPVDSKLFGTDGAGTEVDNSVATLGLFDANSTVAIPGADGFISMGDFGQLIFNLTSSVSTTGLYMYFGEVGDNGEVAGSSITVSDREVVPEPGVLALLLSGLLGLFVARRKV